MIGIKLVKHHNILLKRLPTHTDSQLFHLKTAGHTPLSVAMFSLIKASLGRRCDVYACSLYQFLYCLTISTLKTTTMPYCVAYGCPNDTHDALVRLVFTACR